MLEEKTKSCNGGYWMKSKNGKCYPCPKNKYSPGGKTKHCKPCPKGTTVGSGKGSSKKSCKKSEF